MKRLIRKLQVWRWKRKLRRCYLRYNTITAEYSCGIALADYMSARARDAKAEVNEAIRRVKELDPDKTAGLQEYP